jgi:hypothetical protein
MLPGFRFLFAAIVLSISILVFGLGAAALLRAAHEEFASNPAWHAAPDATFAQQAEATRPVLAMLRVDPLPAPPKASDNIAAIAPAAEQAPAAASTPAAAATAPAEQAAMIPAPVEPDKVAAPKLEETSQPAAAQPETSASETPAPSGAAATNIAADQTKIASVEQGLTEQGLTQLGLPPANEVAPTGSETTPAASTQASALVPPQASSRKIATLGDPATTIGPQTDSATPDRSIIKKRQHARRAAQRRRLALLRARQAQLLALQQQQQQPFDLFGQPQPLAKPAVAARSR